MSKAKEYYDFKAKVIEERELSFNLEVVSPDKYKGLKCWSAKSLMKTYEVLGDIITGKIENWCFASKVKEKEKKEQESKEVVKPEVRAGVPSVINVNFDTSGLAILINGIGEQINGIAVQILDIKAFMKNLLEILLKPEPKTKKAKPKTEPTEAHK